MTTKGKVKWLDTPVGRVVVAAGSAAAGAILVGLGLDQGSVAAVLAVVGKLFGL